MENQILIPVLIVTVIALLIILWQAVLRRKKRKRTVVSALIDIYESGNHHIELAPNAGIHPVDLIQLALSYIANVIFVTWPDSHELKPAIGRLVRLAAQYHDLPDEDSFKQELTCLAESLPQTLLPSGKYAAGRSDRYEVHLIRGNQMDYSLTEFSVHGYRPNLPNSALCLYAYVANRLDDRYLNLLHSGLATLIMFFHENEPTAMNNQLAAFQILEHVLHTFPAPIENSSGRINRTIQSNPPYTRML